MRRVKRVRMEDLVSGEEAMNVRVLQLVVDLGNTVLTKKAVSELMQYVESLPPSMCTANDRIASRRRNRPGSRSHDSFARS